MEVCSTIRRTVKHEHIENMDIMLNLPWFIILQGTGMLIRSKVQSRHIGIGIPRKHGWRLGLIIWREKKFEFNNTRSRFNTTKRVRVIQTQKRERVIVIQSACVICKPKNSANIRLIKKKAHFRQYFLKY